MAGREAELRGEQDRVDALYARLDALRAHQRERLREVRRVGPSGSPQNRSERDAFATLYEDRVAQLEAVEDRLAFGRLDLDDGTQRYIGRIGLTDEDHSTMLTDWRAPAAQAFYRATAAHRDDVVRRRHLVTRGRSVTGDRGRGPGPHGARRRGGRPGHRALRPHRRGCAARGSRGRPDRAHG